LRATQFYSCFNAEVTEDQLAFQNEAGEMSNANKLQNYYDMTKTS